MDQQYPPPSDLKDDLPIPEIDPDDLPQNFPQKQIYQFIHFVNHIPKPVFTVTLTFIVLAFIAMLLMIFKTIIQPQPEPILTSPKTPTIYPTKPSIKISIRPTPTTTPVPTPTEPPPYATPSATLTATPSAKLTPAR